MTITIIKCNFQKELENLEAAARSALANCSKVVQIIVKFQLLKSTKACFIIKFPYTCSTSLLEPSTSDYQIERHSSPWVISKLNFIPKDTGYESLPSRNLPQTGWFKNFKVLVRELDVALLGSLR